MSDLDPCPFCGSEARFISTADGQWCILCRGRGCGCVFGDFAEKSEAVARWNRRPAAELRERAHDSVLVDRLIKHGGLLRQIRGGCWCVGEVGWARTTERGAIAAWLDEQDPNSPGTHRWHTPEHLVAVKTYVDSLREDR